MKSRRTLRAGSATLAAVVLMLFAGACDKEKFAECMGEFDNVGYCIEVASESDDGDDQSGDDESEDQGDDQSGGDESGDQGDDQSGGDESGDQGDDQSENQSGGDESDENQGQDEGDRSSRPSPRLTPQRPDAPISEPDEIIVDTEPESEPAPEVESLVEEPADPGAEAGAGADAGVSAGGATLPRTGADAGSLLLAGSMLTALGAGLRAVSRRRED